MSEVRFGRRDAPCLRRRRRRSASHALRVVAACVALSVALLVGARSAFAFQPPPLTGHVVDTAGVLSRSDVQELDARLDALRQQSGFAIVAFVVGSLDGESIDDVAYKTFNSWKVGEVGRDNGVLLVIAPNDRKVRIETGAGVEGALTDLQSNDIIRQQIAPLLKQNRFRDAIALGSDAIARALVHDVELKQRSGARSPMPPHRGPAGEPVSLGSVVLWILGLVAVVVLAIVSPAFRSLLWMLFLFGGGRGGGGGGGGGGSGYGGGGGRSGGGGSSDSY